MLKKAECFLLMKEFGEASSYAVYGIPRCLVTLMVSRGILQSDPTNPGAWFIRGQCSYFDVSSHIGNCYLSHCFKGDAEKAKEMFQKALTCDPDFSQARVALKARSCGLHQITELPDRKPKKYWP
jgi:tetratricopeptide (TPR) repeat protein